MAYGTAPTSGGTGDAVTTDSITTIDGGAGSGEAQIIKVAYGSVGDANVVSASQPFPTSLSTTPFVPVAGNSSSANIASGAAFTGTISANPSQASISINVISDQPVQIKLRQFTDAAGLNAVPEVSCPAVYTNGFYACNVCVPANSNYWQIYALNIGSATTTKFIVDCGTGWLWPVTAQGNLPASINEIGGTAVAGSLPVTVNAGTQGLSVRAQTLDDALANDKPLGTFLTGDPGGDFAGINLLEAAFDQQLRMPVNTPDLAKGGANAGLLLADGAQSFYTASTGSALGLGVIDTTGYGSLIVSGYAGGGTVQVFFSDNGSVWNQVFGTRNYNGGSVDAATAVVFTPALAGTLIYPVSGRYAQIRMTAVTTAPATASVVLKYASAPQFPAAYVSTSNLLTVNASQLFGQNVGAEDSAAQTAPVIVGGVVRNTTTATTIVAGDAMRATMTSGGALVVKDYSVAGADWRNSLTLTTTTAQAAKAAGAANIINYVTAIQFQNTNATATTLLIQDGASTIWQVSCAASMASPLGFTFPTPLGGTAATAMNVNCGTTAANVIVNIQGYQSTAL